jgi:Ni,Fe-hydrogenase III component G
MNLSPLGLALAKVPSAVPALRAEVTSAELLAACRAAADQGARLVALWSADDRDLGRGFRLSVLLADDDGLLLLQHRLPNDAARYPDLTGIFPAAGRALVPRRMGQARTSSGPTVKNDMRSSSP